MHWKRAENWHSQHHSWYGMEATRKLKAQRGQVKSWRFCKSRKGSRTGEVGKNGGLVYSTTTRGRPRKDSDPILGWQKHSQNILQSLVEAATWEEWMPSEQKEGRSRSQTTKEAESLELALHVEKLHNISEQKRLKHCNWTLRSPSTALETLDPRLPTPPSLLFSAQHL